MSLLEDAIDHILNDLCFDAFEAGENHGRPPDSSAYTRRVLALLREGPWFDGAVERIAALFTFTDEWGNPDPDCARALAEIVLRAALGEDT